MIKNILWDFDGVILDSMKIKGDGFVTLFQDYDEKYIKEIEKYHYENGGVSRFEKIRYFYTHILQQEISEEKVSQLASEFALIVEKKLYDKKNLIDETREFIKNNYQKYHFHIVSGAEEKELQKLCKFLEIEKYFITINGSPTKKSILIKNILKQYNYKKEETILIGDAKSDYEASRQNEIEFYGYNNEVLKQFGNYIQHFDKIFGNKIEWIDTHLEVLKKEFNKKIAFYIKKNYQSSINIANPVLSRNIYSSNLFHYFCFYKYDGSMPKKLSFQQKLLKILKYYIRSFIHFLFIIMHGFIYKISYKKKISPRDKDIILVDTFTMIDKIYPYGFEDNYFKSVYDVLEKKQVNFAILSILFGDKPYNLKRRYQTYKLLQQSPYTFISEFELLEFVDYIHLFFFILKYPIANSNIKSKETKDNFEKLYNITIDETIDSVQVHNYVRYLFGRRLGKYFKKNIKLISWDENQVIHKLLNKGLRDTKKKHINIIGTKFFGFTPNWIHLENIQSEVECGVSPDVILTKGKYFNRYFHTQNVQVGFAPRESYLFECDITLEKDNNLGVLFGYDIDDNKEIIQFIQNSDTSLFQNIIVRLHPNHKTNPPFFIPNDWIIDDGSLINFSNHCKKIISTGTGAALECMMLGSFIILLGGKESPTTNMLIKDLQGTSWDIFYTHNQLEHLLQKEYQCKKIDIGFYFQKATKEAIVKSLGLEG